MRLVLFMQVRRDTPIKRIKLLEQDGEAVVDTIGRSINLCGGVLTEFFSGRLGTKVAYLARVAALTLAVIWVSRITVST